MIQTQTLAPVGRRSPQSVLHHQRVRSCYAHGATLHWWQASWKNTAKGFLRCKGIQDSFLFGDLDSWLTMRRLFAQHQHRACGGLQFRFRPQPPRRGEGGEGSTLFSGIWKFPVVHYEACHIPQGAPQNTTGAVDDPLHRDGMQLIVFPGSLPPCCNLISTSVPTVATVTLKLPEHSNFR